MDLPCQSHSNSLEFAASEIGAGTKKASDALYALSADLYRRLGVRSPARGQINKRSLHRLKSWEVIADNLSKAVWSWGCVATVDREGRTIFVADAHRGDGKHFAVQISTLRRSLHVVRCGRFDPVTALRVKQ
jgi:hypothetical protein